MATMKGILLIAAFCLAGTTQAQECDSLPGLEEILRPGAVLLLGEIHGTRQGPEMVAKVVCQALSSGINVSVGLEIPITEQESLDNYFDRQLNDSSRADLIGGDFWQRDYQDGRASQAMLALIEKLKEFSIGQENDLHLFFLDDPNSERGRDWFMANRIAQEVASHPGQLVVTLTGNVHSQLITGNAISEDYEPMGYLVSQMVQETNIISLDMVYTGGTAWVDANGYRPGVITIGGKPDAVGEPIELSGNSGHRYFGLYRVGQIEASRPAKEL
ncbi:MAG: hypothetical protein P1R58_12750 [bacterium]|nr:hypothetical protein [bacterium]